MKKVSKWKSLSDEEFKIIVENSLSIGEILFKCGYSAKAGSIYKEVNEHIKSKGYSTDHFKRLVMPRSVVDENMFSEESLVSRHAVKKRILDENLLSYVCSECNLDPYWNGKELTLILDHINGKNNDNRLSNLRFLCPNCNSQQETFAGRNIGSINSSLEYVKNIEERKINHSLINENNNNLKELKSIKRKSLRESIKSIKKEELIEILKETKSFTGASKIVGFSDRTVKKVCQSFGINYSEIFNLDYKKDEIILFYKENGNMKKTAKNFKTKVSNIRRIIKDQFPIKMGYPIPINKQKEVKELREKGYKLHEIAEKLNVSMKSVQKYK